MAEINCQFFRRRLLYDEGANFVVLAMETGVKDHCAQITDAEASCILKLADEPVDWNACPYNPKVNGAFLDTGIPAVAPVGVADFGAAFEALGREEPVTPGILREMESERAREFQELGIPGPVNKSLPAAVAGPRPSPRDLRKADPAAVLGGLSEVKRGER